MVVPGHGLIRMVANDPLFNRGTMHLTHEAASHHIAVGRTAARRVSRQSEVNMSEGGEISI